MNALYPVMNDGAVNSAWGPGYATLRSEFLDLPPKRIRERAERVLITFGGTDPAGLAERCARLLSARAPRRRVRVVPGPAPPRTGSRRECVVRVSR